MEQEENVKIEQKNETVENETPVEVEAAVKAAEETAAEAAGQTKEENNEPDAPLSGSDTAGGGRLWRNAKKGSTYRMVMLAILIAMTAALQIAGSYIKPIGPTSLSFVLIPIVIGGILLGVKGGAVLGATFGIVTIIMGFTGMDPFTAYLLSYSAGNAVITCTVCLIKAVAAGIVPAVVHIAMKKKWPFASTVIAAVSAPVTNTGIFLLGTTLMLKPLAGITNNIIYFLFVTILVFNFLVELAINVVAVPAIYRIWQAIGRKREHA